MNRHFYIELSSPLPELTFIELGFQKEGHRYYKNKDVMEILFYYAPE